MTLRTKLFFGYGILLILALSLTAVFIIARDHREWARFLEDGNRSLSSFTTTDLVRAFGTFYRSEDPNQRQRFIDRLSELFKYNRDLEELSIIRRGEILFKAGRREGQVTVEPATRPEPVRDPLVDRVMKEGLQNSEVVESKGRVYTDIVTPAFGPEGGGELLVRYRFGDTTLRNHGRELVITLAGIAFLVGVFSLILAATLARALSSPLKDLIPLTERVAGGDYSARMTYDSKDEIGTLVTAFNRMAEGLEDSKRALDRLGEQLVRSEKLATVGQMAAGLSHELDNPLGVIKGFTERLLSKIPDDDPKREELEIVREEALRCRRLIGGLLDYSRGRPGRREAVSLLDLCHSSLSFLKTNRSFDSIKVVVDIPSDLPPLMVDSDRLRQVVVNLTVNACQAMPQSGTLILSGGAAESLEGLPPEIDNPQVREEIPLPAVWLEVKDSGIGIPVSIQDRIFEPLFSNKSGGEGTGLGLSICQKIVEGEEGGRIFFTSHEGDGTSFFIFLPIGGNHGN